MATLSRRTIVLVCEAIKVEDWSHSKISDFFYENEVPVQLDDKGSNRPDRIRNVFQRCEENGDTKMLLRLIESAVKKFQPQSRKQVEDALLRDGFGVVDGRLLDAEPEVAENRTVMDALLDRHSTDYDIETLRHHLRVSTDMFRQEQWDTSISHCRNFVEQLLDDVAKAVGTRRNEQPNLSRPVYVRDYLEKVGFFDKAERSKLVDGVYGYFSEEGSHPGLSTQSAARISHSILASFGLYILEKYDAWKSGGLVLRQVS